MNLKKVAAEKNLCLQRHRMTQPHIHLGHRVLAQVHPEEDENKIDFHFDGKTAEREPARDH